MARQPPLFAALALASLSSACIPEFDTDLSELREPQVLAIASTPAEAGPEKPVQLQALVAVPEGQSPPRLSWSMCLARKPLTELGPVNPLCFDAPDGSNVIDLGTGDSATAALDKDVCKLFGPLRPAPTGTEGAGRPADPDITGGFYQPFVARLGSATTLGGVRIDCDLVSVNRDDSVDYRKRYRSNENPRIAEIARVTGNALEALDRDAEPLRISVGSRITLRASWDECSGESTCGDSLCTAFEDSTTCAQDCTENVRGCTGAEPYVWYDRQRERVAPRREGISIAWYASRGHFESEQTGLDESEAASRNLSENTYVAGSQPGKVTLWLVIRDARGGQSWEVRHLEVTP